MNNVDSVMSGWSLRIAAGIAALTLALSIGTAWVLEQLRLETSYNFNFRAWRDVSIVIGIIACLALLHLFTVSLFEREKAGHGRIGAVVYTLIILAAFTLLTSQQHEQFWHAKFAINLGPVLARLVNSFCLGMAGLFGYWLCLNIWRWIKNGF